MFGWNWKTCMDNLVGLVYQVKKVLASISQGSMSIPEYYARIKSIWDELSTLSVHSDSHCTCGGGRLDIQKREEDQRLYQFLMGLNEIYGNARTNLLIMSHFPTIKKAYSLLLNDERQREIQPPPFHFKSESVSFSVGSQRFSHPKTSFDPRRPNMVCSYCNNPGHTLLKCYKKYGFLPNFKFTTSTKRFAANVQTELDVSKQFARPGTKSSTETSTSNMNNATTTPVIPDLTHE
ncbi:uncharacterized protein [Nicotiana tomentosiformis]|uniref:uncharacterized protein n=1 Tax=Nicotiana tomentosiformis TaxID=4098 RepID=UPI000877F44C